MLLGIKQGTKKYQSTIQRVLLTLCTLFVVGFGEMWGFTVTYRIINLGRLDDNGAITTSRTLALEVSSSDATVALPDAYKSPLAKNWQYYAASDVSYDSDTKVCTFNSGPSLTEGVSTASDGDEIYVTYELNENALTTVIDDGDEVNIKLYNEDNYHVQDTWSNNVNTDFYASTNTKKLPEGKYSLKAVWHFNIVDPYQITLQTKSSTYPDYYLAAGDNFGDIRLYNTLTKAKGTGKGVWAFAILPGGNTGTYRLIVTDGCVAVGNNTDSKGHGYLNDANGHSRYHSYYSNGSTHYKCDMELLPLTRNYTYHIVDKNGNIAIQYTVSNQEVGEALIDYTGIPEAIRSPYLSGEAVTFYSFDGDFDSEKLTDENKVTATPRLKDNIYVTYTTDHLMEKFLHLRGVRPFNVKINDKYIYDSGTAGSGVLSTESTLSTDNNHFWYINNNDPYAVTLKNDATQNYLGYTTPSTVSLETSPANKCFILMGNTRGNGVTHEQLELMAATGGSDFYRVGLSGDAVNISTTATGDASVQIQAYPYSITSHYYLIDKAGKLIAGPVMSTSAELYLPDEWRSPLVSAYHYYKTSGYNDETQTYSPSDVIESPIDADDPDYNIYVTYDVNDAIDLEGRKTYRMKFSGGESFYQEDGSDGVMTEKRTAVYPYVNGDYNLYVYGQERWEQQLADGASTRTRWLWYIVSNHDGTPLTGNNVDPYHVRIKARQAPGLKYNDVTYSGDVYLRTYVPHGTVATGVAYVNTDYETAAGVDLTDEPTEYMILGTSTDNMTLKTFNTISDGSTDERRVVNSFEQYWKNNPTAYNILKANGQTVTDGTSVATQLSDAQQTILQNQGWHSYQVWANAADWSSNPKESKSFKEGYHWFQTIEMGDEFTLVETELDPVLILLDQHGWEIVRVKLPHGPDDRDRDARYEALHKYSSPMVKTYHYYKTAVKVGGYHKYDVDKTSYATISDTDLSEYTSTTLGSKYNLPNYATQALDAKNNERDWYVTYDVIEDYANSYTGAATEDAVSASTFLIKQGGKYASSNGGTSINSVDAPKTYEDIPNAMLWYLKPNFNIDAEMGYKYAGETGAQTDAESKTDMEAAYDANGQNGFDPYNMQIENKAYPLRYFTANTSSSALSSGAWKGTSNAVTLQNLGTKQTATGHDQAHLQITNATFMVVDDGNGNMRLMPRFDNSKVATSFSTLSAQLAAAEVGDDGTGTQTFITEIIAAQTEIHSSDEITAMNGNYLLASDFTFAAGFESLGTAEAPFTGKIDGQLQTFSGLTKPLINYARNAIIKNIILDNVTVRSGNSDGHAGAIACTATGSTRIYNCGVLGTTSSITGTGTGHVGSILGHLEGNTRVINCFSFATVNGGTWGGGIVGYNSTATTQDNVGTSGMVMNCMFYGEVASGKEGISPVFGGANISNNNSDPNEKALNTFNYFRYMADYCQNGNITAYNCALGAKELHLKRFEFYRNLLNSNRDLAAWYATGSVDNADTKMAKWVYDKSAADYPILKVQGTYPSVINYDPEYTYDLTDHHKILRSSVPEVNNNQGRKLGTLQVNISDGKNGPSNATIVASSLTLPILDKDTANYNFNYYKVQLPYYNEVGRSNYTENKVVTGWKVTVSGGSTSYNTSSYDASIDGSGNITTPYNFADRNSTGKDDFGTSGRIFPQGGYFNVPEGVSSISIEPYWGTAVYLSDPKYDKVANKSYTLADVDAMGDRPTSITIDGSTQTVNTTIGDALTALTSTSCTPYDQAIVLVGNYHIFLGKVSPFGTEKPCTIMSIDLNMDNEPDYSLMLAFQERQVCPPIRFDFLNLVPFGIAQKVASTEAPQMPNIAIFKPKGWFEVTTTCITEMTEFEYEYDGKTEAPLIFLGGHIGQIVSQNSGNYDAFRTTYIHLGDNVLFDNFCNGIHSDKKQKTRHCPISVTGGEYKNFYLSGLYKPGITPYDDGAECYVNGGKFGEVAGAAHEKIKNNVFWVIDHADIDHFFGGGINDANPVLGNINVTINNSNVELYCGGPKFGNMQTGKTVTTNATGTTFGTFFGAGYGGTALNRVIKASDYKSADYGWTSWDDKYTRSFSESDGGIATSYETEFFAWAGGTTAANVGRFYVNFASLSLANTNDVTSTLTGCTVETNFYGGGNLGAVTGNVTSTLTNTTVNGNAFGAGFSASVPSVDVYPTTGFVKVPSYNSKVGIFNEPTYPTAVAYTWSSKGSNESPFTKDEDGYWIHTDVILTNLGKVTGNVTLTINGTSVIGNEENTDPNASDAVKAIGNVYGGGEQSDVARTANDANATNGNTIVNVSGSTIISHDVFGGGKGLDTDYSAANVAGNATVTIQGSPQIYHSVYGGGQLASVGTFVYTDNVASSCTYGGTATVNIYGGTLGRDGQEDGMVYGSSRGEIYAPGEKDKFAWVNTTQVNIGKADVEGTILIKGSIYGSGENGHTLANATVNVVKGTIGITSGTPITIDEVEYSGAAYPYRGNVYGGGCGTDMYDSNSDNVNDAYNPLSGIVMGNTTVNISGGQVVRNVYGAGAMGSVGKTNGSREFTSGGTTTIDISGGTIGVDGTKGDGNVFGAARGDASTTQNNVALVKTTHVNISQASGKTTTIYHNVYGGGEVGDVGTYTTGTDGTNTYTTGSGACDVDVTGGTIHGNVFGAGKGDAGTYECKKAMVSSTDVSITNGTVHGNVYGGGERGRVENSSVVKVGDGAGAESGGTSTPDVKGSVFGAGAGVETHGYSALVRGNSTVTIEGNAKVEKNVYGGGEIAAVGKYWVTGVDYDQSLNAPEAPVGMPNGMPYATRGGGACTVVVQGYAQIGPDGAATADAGHVFGAGKGVMPSYASSGDNRSKRMMTYNSTDYTTENQANWEYTDASQNYVWEYFAAESSYLEFIETLALASVTDVSIDGHATVKGSVYGGSENGFVQEDTDVKIEGNSVIGTSGTTTYGHIFGGGKGLATFAAAGRVGGNTTVALQNGTVYGSVYGGGEMGVVKQNVTVSMTNGTVAHDVYGGGALADTNTGNWDATANEGAGDWAEGMVDSDGKTTYKTTVNLTGGLIKGDAYGGGLGRLAAEGVSAVEAKEYGDVFVNLGGESESSATAFNISYYTEDHSSVVKSGRVFGCNNLNGSPKGNVTVTVYKTVEGNTARTVEDPDNTGMPQKGENVTSSYELAAVYGGGNLANYEATGKKTNVIIYTCDVSVKEVYGGGNAAEVPETDVLIRGAYEIQTVFGGGNGNDDYTLDGGSTWVTNPGANVNGDATTLLTGGYIHEAYGGSNEKGTITGSVFIDVGEGGACTLDLGKMVGAGKNADVEGDLIVVMGCKPTTKIPVLYAGADNANVNGDVELTITSGNFGKVFGGNNAGGYILGHIKLNIEETGNCPVPITIDELYLGGNEAAYSQYGYYNAETDATKEPDYQPRTAAMAAITDPEAEGYTPAITTISGGAVRKTAPYAQPELNIISCTRIGKVFGGGYGTGATIYGDPIVNINMIPGSHATSIDLDGDGSADSNAHALGDIGDVYGGGNQAAVYGNTTINIGTVETVELTSVADDPATTTVNEHTPNVEGARITGNVYGGGNLANVGQYHLGTDSNGKTIDVIDIVGNTNVNIGAVVNDDTSTTDEVEYTAVTISGTDFEGVTIAGNVFGGGKGEAEDEVDGSFRCGKAMVTGSTSVAIGNGTVGTLSEGELVEGTGTVYGGGEVGRVEENTTVTIGVGAGVSTGTITSAPDIRGSVFGGGKGVNTHGYSALVRGNPTVIVQGNAKVGVSVFGGGEIASVGKYTVAQTAEEATANGVEVGMPYSLVSDNRGICKVKVRGYAEIGPNNMQMPDDRGHVYGAGMGVMPYGGYADSEQPKRMTISNKWETYQSWNNHDDSGLEQYLQYIETLGLATQTNVTIGGHAFVKGSVYGGSQNGFVQHDTHVTIEGDCQIGNGDGVNARYASNQWINPFETTVTNDNALAECAHWPYGKVVGEKTVYLTHDQYAIYDGYYDEEKTRANYAEGGSNDASDGHTFYGNVFGGGSGYLPYKPGKWHDMAGNVGGNTLVDITGGHILTSLYGGNELTNVGKDGVENTGKCTVNFGGTATLGVPRTIQQIIDHPVTCYLFGAGKGDQRVLFNKDTNVTDVEVKITGGTIYGSVFGGGEDGHVLRNVKMTIGNDNGTGPIIGTWGTSYVDGNVFGGGRGFGGDAYTAGNVAGSIDLDIKGGTMLGSIYGGGRLGSVGYGLYDEGVDGYGEMRDDGKNDDGTDGKSYFTNGRGHIDITISGGTIGNSLEYVYPTDAQKSGDLRLTSYDATTNRLTHTKGGNVFTGGMGRRTQLDGTTPITKVDWKKLGNAKSTKLTITDGIIKSNVYGGGELGAVVGSHTTNSKAWGTEIIISGGTIGTQIPAKEGDGGGTAYYFGSVFGGGMGALYTEDGTANVLGGGDVTSNTLVKISGSNTKVEASVYGGGELAQVDGSTDVQVSGGTIGESGYGGVEYGNIYGGGKGSIDNVGAGLVKTNTNVTVSGSPQVWHNIYGGGAYGSVGEFTYDASTGLPTSRKEGTSGGKATVTITGGTIGRNGKENGMVYGSSRGDVGALGSVHDKLAWVYETEVNIGSSDQAVTTSPAVKGSVYGSGENGHTFTNTEVNVFKGTIGIAEGETITVGEGDDEKSYSGAAYPYRGNVYGGGCGTDKYYSSTIPEGHTAQDGQGDTYNPLSGIVWGTTTVTMSDGQVVRNVYGAGAMGSVGKTNDSREFTSGGTTNVTISGGTIGVDGTNGDGNVFGAARGDATNTQNNVALVKTTDVNISGTTTDIKGSVYGGGEVGDVGTYSTDATTTTNTYTTGSGYCDVDITGGTIHGDVFGAGKGESSTFECKKAMVDSTDVCITNGIVKGTVYGGGEIGRVEHNTWVTIGTENDSNSEPVIEGDVFGAGKGLVTHVYSALVRGDAYVTIQGNATVKNRVFGGGMLATVGRYELDANGLPDQTKSGGKCTVIVRDNAVIGPDGGMKMVTSSGKPDDTGYVVGAGRGILPYETFEAGERPWRMGADDNPVYFNSLATATTESEADYFKFIGSLGLASETYVTITDNAFVKGAVYGGSMNGYVQTDTHVTIAGDCQIGQGYNETTGESDPKYTSWTNEDPSGYHECAHWPYTAGVHTVFDPYVKAVVTDSNGKQTAGYYDDGKTQSANGGVKIPQNGQTFYGNVFAGGCGYYPFAPGRWLEAAGSVGGNTYLEMTGGHVLTSVYGGNEMTDVKGNATVTITGGTVGVPRTKTDMENHPVTCYVFGGGKGDQRTWFNTKTNIEGNATVTVKDDARIFGSTFGGGEDGHVFGDVETIIGEIGDGDKPLIGSTGTSAVDGNIFGGGRGFTETAYTAGSIGGNVKLTINSGKMLGTVYGGGRLASVGSYFVNPTLDDGKTPNPKYGTLQPDGDDPSTTDVTETGNHGHITIEINGGTIGATDKDTNNNDVLRTSDYSIGDVFGGCKGSVNGNWKFGLSKYTTITINDGTINGNVYGGGEMGGINKDTHVTVKGGSIGKNVYGGGMGSATNANVGQVHHNVVVDIQGGIIGKNVYGGGAIANTNTHDKDNPDGSIVCSSTPRPDCTTKVNLTGGLIKGDAYGGGEGLYYVPESPSNTQNPYDQSDWKDAQKTSRDAYGAQVYGDVTVTLDGTAFIPRNDASEKNTDGSDIPVAGRIFGCNNYNGSPKGTVLVHVKKTVPVDANGTSREKAKGSYELGAVYGGGNLAGYLPYSSTLTADGQFSTYTDKNDNEVSHANASKPIQVVIDGCDDTSIEYIYGGSNAADVPATDVLVLGCYEIGNVFGGGNGKDKIHPSDEIGWINNFGAEVGAYWYDRTDYDGNTGTTYGTGVATTSVLGGTVHNIFGGSNTLGNVYVEAVTTVDSKTDCQLVLDELYGGGNEAYMEGGSNIILGCINYVKRLFGGAKNADVDGDVNLTITSGRFDQVFGGNNLGGTINGSITLNIEETGCSPIIIGELYGCGNNAAYTTPAGKTGPTLNIRSFTSIGRVFGGGRGETATVTGDVTVNINEVKGANSEAAMTASDKTTIDAINLRQKGTYVPATISVTNLDANNNPVSATETVNMPTHTSGKIGAIGTVFGGGNAAKVVGNTTVNIGTETTTTFVSIEDNTSTADDERVKNVEGVDIRENVYGGGNAADVEGSTNVTIGQ